MTTSYVKSMIRVEAVGQIVVLVLVNEETDEVVERLWLSPEVAAAASRELLRCAVAANANRN